MGNQFGELMNTEKKCEGIKVWYLPVCNTNSPPLVYLLQGAVATAHESLPLYYYSMVNVDLTQFYLFDRPDSHLQSATCKEKKTENNGN